MCECRRDSDCPDGEICDRSGNGAFSCMDAFKSVGEECAVPSQCISSSCFNSICECRRDLDCLDGEFCDKSGDPFLCKSTLFTMSPTALPTPEPTPSARATAVSER